MANEKIMRRMATKGVFALLSNKKVQRAAVNAGYNLGVGAVKKIQARRRRKGRIQLFPTVTAAPRPLTRTTNVGIRTQQTQGGMAASSTSVERGTAVVSTITHPGTTPNSMLEYIVNPADSEFVTRLAKVASLYQKFKCTSMVLRYTPQQATTVAGQIAMAFVPNVKEERPATISDVAQLGGMTVALVSQPVAVRVDVNAMNKSYVQQFCGLAEDGNTDQINVVGKIFVALAGCPTGSATQFGMLQVDYSFTFSDPKVSTADQVSGIATQYTAAGDETDLSALIPTRGYPGFVETSIDDFYKRRGQQALRLVIKGSTAAPSLWKVQITSTFDPATLADLSPEFSVSDGNGEDLRVYRLPRGDVWCRVITPDNTNYLISWHPDN